MRTLRLALGCALVLFGAMAASSTRSYAAESEECDGRSDQLCRSSVSETCTEKQICEIRFGLFFIPYFVECCEEYEIVEDYYYYRHAGEAN